MSDHVVQSDHDSDGISRQSVHFYQSVWMSHWMHTSYKSENQGNEPLSIRYEYRDHGGDGKQRGSEIPPEFTKSAKGFRQVSESRTVDIMNESLKLSSMNFGKERSESHSFPKFNLSQNRESTLALTNDRTCHGAVSKMGTSSRECHVQPKDISRNLEHQVKSHASPEKKSLAVSTSFQHDVGSRSKIVPNRYNNGKSPMRSFRFRQDEIKQPSPVVASKEHITKTKFQSHSTSLVHEKKTNNPLDFRGSETLSLRQNIMPLLHHGPSAINHFVSDQLEKMQKHSGTTRLFPNWSSHLDPSKSDALLHDLNSVPKVPHSCHDVETMRICTTVDSAKKINGGPSKFSQTTHHFLITNKTDVNVSEGGEMFRDSMFPANIKGKMFSEFLSSSPGFGFHGQQGVKLQSLGSSTDTEGNENFGEVKTSAVCLKNESSAETDTMDMDVYQKNHLSGVVSSPINEIIKGGQISSILKAKIASSKEEVGGELLNTELPDMNQELPALPDLANSVDEKETSASRTQSLDAEHLLSHAELPTSSKSIAFPDGPVGSDPSTRWAKRLKLSAPGFVSHGTKSCKMEETSSHEKVNNFFSKLMRYHITSSESTRDECPDKEQTTLDQTAVLLLRNADSSPTESVRKITNVSLSIPWIQRWCHHTATSATQSHDAVVCCEPQKSNVALDEFQKKQFPSIAAMALMGKALNSFQPCEFRKRGSYVVWKT